jgi:uncharacterized protein YxjI
MRYVVRQKIFSIGDRFTIKDENGNDIFYVKKQILSIGKKLRIFDMMDNELCYIEQKILKFMPEYNVYSGGQHIANVKKKFAFFKNDFTINSPNAQYHVDGNVWGHEFAIYRENTIIGQISKKYFSFSDTYGVDVDDNENQVTVLALAIVIDMVLHDKNS